MNNAISLIPNRSANAYALVPSAHGSIEAYISAVNKIPLLTLAEEIELATRLKLSNDLEAAQRLVASHLRVVVSTARQYLGYGLPHADLIQEGNVGLMKAVKRFDPERGVRLVSFALHWIKAEIHEYILKNWRMVKVATTKAQRKLFFNLRSMKGENGNHGAMTEADVARIATTLEVKPTEVREMDMRLSGRDVLLDPTPDDGEADFGPISYLEDSTREPTAMIANLEHDALSTTGLQNALAQLDERSRSIVARRWLSEDDVSAPTLHDLAAEYGVSAERIRQIEVAAMKKLKGFLS